MIASSDAETRWTAISGSWRVSSPELECDVRDTVSDIMRRGGGIVTGGALGVDFVATEEALVHNTEADRLKIIIPTPLEVYATYFRQRAYQGVITLPQAEALIGLLTQVQQTREQSLVELGHPAVNEAAYYDRNTHVLEEADELAAFQVNGSMGVQDTVDKAYDAGMDVQLRRYSIAA